MFERFTDRARRVVVLAQEEARLLSHGYIGTEHLLLGLLHEGGGVPGKALEALSISLDGARAQVVAIVSRGQDEPSGHIPFTPRAKKILELSLREAMELGHDYIGPEHILLGIVREDQGVASQVLATLGANGHRVRAEVMRFIQEGQGEAAEEEAARLPPSVRPGAPPAQLAQVMRRLGQIDGRLAAIERHLGIAPGQAGPGGTGPGGTGPGGEVPPETG